MMAKYITQAQMDELEEACSSEIEDGHALLRKYAGIEACPFCGGEAEVIPHRFFLRL